MTEDKPDASRKQPSPAPERVPVPGWLPPLVYLLATLILFRDFIVSDEMLFGGDTLGLGYMARAFYAEALRDGVFPFWNPVILGGTPFLDSLAGGDSLYPPSVLLLFLTETYRSLGWKLVLHVFAAGWLMYAWARTVGISRAGALLTGLAYLAAPFFVTLVYPGHDGKMFVTALAPLGFLAAERVMAGGRIRDIGLLALLVGMVILTTHFQMAYFLFGAMGAYAIFRAVQLGREGAWGPSAKRFGLFLAGAVLGAGIASVQLLPAVEYIREFSRRTATTTQAESAETALEYSSSYSLNPEEAMSLVVPEFVGHGLQGGADWTNGTYWGRNPLKLNHEYLGWAAMLLAILAFFGARQRALRRFLLGLGLVALLFAMGRTLPVWRIFYEVFPGISLFRAPSQAIFVTGFAWLTLAGFGFDRGLALFFPEGRAPDSVADDRTRVLRVLWGLTGLMGLGFVLWSTGILQGLWTGLLYSDIPPVRQQALERAAPFIARGFGLATLLTAAVAGVWTAASRGWLTPLVLTAALGGILFLDAARVDDPFLQTFDFQRWAAPDANMRYLSERLDDPEPWRLLSMVQAGQDVTPGMFGIELAGGHHPNDLGRYRELIGMVGGGQPTNLLQNPALLSLLNVRYLLWPVAQLGDQVQGIPQVSAVTLGDGRVYSAVYELPALPRARLVGRTRVVPDDQAVQAMMDPGFDPTAEVLLPSPSPVPIAEADVTGSVSWSERGINRSVLEVQSSAPALLVIADNWFPRWQATVNGAEAPVLRAYHTLRAVPVPAGESTVEVVYAPAKAQTALGISVVSLLLALVAVGAGLVRNRRVRGGSSD